MEEEQRSAEQGRSMSCSAIVVSHSDGGNAAQAFDQTTEEDFLEANQRLALQLLEVMFGKEDNSINASPADTQVAHHLSPALDQMVALQQQPAAGNTTPLHHRQQDELTSAVDGDGIVDDYLALTSPSLADEDMMRNLVNLEDTGEGEFETTTAPPTSGHVWDYQALGLELGMDLNVDLDFGSVHGGESEGLADDDDVTDSLFSFIGCGIGQDHPSTAMPSSPSLLQSLSS